MDDGGLVLKATALACERGGRRVFDALSFQVSQRGALLVQGPNGAGKSSLLRILAGLLPAAGGYLSNPFRLAYLGHDNALKPGERLRDELAFWARLDGQPVTRVDAALEHFNLLPLAGLPVRVLSSGQRRRAALARIWLSDAVLWLLDEPSVGLDAASTARLAALMRTHRTSGGIVVATSHVPLGLDDADVLELGVAA